MADEYDETGRYKLSELDKDGMPKMRPYLRNLAERLRDVPAKYDVDGGDVDMLNDIATSLDELAKEFGIGTTVVVDSED